MNAHEQLYRDFLTAISGFAIAPSRSGDGRPCLLVVRIADMVGIEIVCGPGGSLAYTDHDTSHLIRTEEI